MWVQVGMACSCRWARILPPILRWTRILHMPSHDMTSGGHGSGEWDGAQSVLLLSRGRGAHDGSAARDGSPSTPPLVSVSWHRWRVSGLLVWIMYFALYPVHHAATPYYIILYHTISYYIILYHTIHHTISSYIILYHTISYYIIPYHTISYYIILYHTTSYYIILHHTISYYIPYYTHSRPNIHIIPT